MCADEGLAGFIARADPRGVIALDGRDIALKVLCSMAVGVIAVDRVAGERPSTLLRPCWCALRDRIS